LEGELIDYIPTWHHGLCMMRFLPQRARTKERMQVAEQFGGLKFENPVFLFNKRPPSEAYGLNKLMFESRHSAELRHRIINDFETVADEYGLKGRQREAAKELINVGQGGKVSDHVAPLAEAGAHPLRAVMSLPVIFSTSHARGQAAMAATAKH